MDGGVGLRLEGAPELLAPASLPGHRILTFTLANEGRDVTVVAAQDLSLAAPDGSPVKATFTFDREERRPGAAVQAKRAALSPRGSVGVIAVWRDSEAAQVVYPGGAAPIAEPAPTSEPLA